MHSEDISVTTLEDTDKEITLKATDVEGSDLTYSIVGEPENGTITQDGKSVVFTLMQTTTEAIPLLIRLTTGQMIVIPLQ